MVGLSDWRRGLGCVGLMLGLAAGVGAQELPPVLGLLEAYQLAARQDANLRASRWQVEAVAERLVQAKAQLKPNVSLAVSRFKNDLDRTQPNVLGAETTVHDRYFSYNQTLQLRQPLYRPALVLGVDVAQAQLQDAQAVLMRDEQSTAIKVAEAYLQTLQSQAVVVMLTTQVAMADRQLDAARKRFEAGQGVRTDIDETLARMDLISAQLLEAQQARQTALLQLRLLTQSPVQSVRPLTTDGALDMRDIADQQTWVQRALDSSPDIKALQARVEAAQMEVRRAQSAHRPTLDALVQVSRSGSENVSSPSSSHVNRQIGLQLNVPLYAGGAIQSGVRQALAEESRAQELLEATRRDVELRVQREWRNTVESARRATALEKAVASADRMVMSVTKSFEAGVRTVLDVLNAEEKKQHAVRDLTDARLQHVASRLRLQALAGSLSEDHIRMADAWFAATP